MNTVVLTYISALVGFLHKIMLTDIYSSLVSVTLPLAFSIHIYFVFHCAVFFHIFHHISFETYKLQNIFC